MLTFSPGGIEVVIAVFWPFCCSSFSQYVLIMFIQTKQKGNCVYNLKFKNKNLAFARSTVRLTTYHFLARLAGIP